MLREPSLDQLVSARVSGPAPDVDCVADAWERHHAELRRHALRMTRDEDAAADLVQDAFAQLVVEVRKGRTPTNVRAWLFRVTTNAMISQQRHAGVVARTAARLAADVSEAGPESAYLAAEQRAEVDAMLSIVSPEARTALLLAAHGVAGNRIAAEVKRSPVATRALLFRTRGRLRRSLEPGAIRAA